MNNCVFHDFEACIGHLHDGEIDCLQSIHWMESTREAMKYC